MTSTHAARDDLGTVVDLPGRPNRVVSLVPSLTEALASVDMAALVGVTDWCTHPEGIPATRIRGTKNPDVAAIIELQPDLVVANQEENRKLDVERLRAAGVPVWVTRIETVEESLASMSRLFTDALRWPLPLWLTEAAEIWSAPPRLTGVRVAVPIWRDPWMVVGPRTFTADLLHRIGCSVVPATTGDRYPKVDVATLDHDVADVILLPDEPYIFTGEDGPEAFRATPTTLVSGRMLTWYGPSLGPARKYLEDLLRPWSTPNP